MPTAAAVIIGNEILSGKFADENGPYFVSRLRVLGCDLKRLITIGDTVLEIGAEVSACSAAHDFVFTTGGVGPTHDDVTLEGIGAAFGLPLHTHPDLVALIEHYGLPLNDASLRMASIPEGAELVRSPGSSFPVVVVRNVYVFPGVPRLLKVKFETVAHRFAGELVRTERLFVDQHETVIAADLAAVQARWPMVDIGSYPRFGEGNFRVIITLESRDDHALAAAVQALRECLPLVHPEP